MSTTKVNSQLITRRHLLEGLFSAQTIEHLLSEVNVFTSSSKAYQVCKKLYTLKLYVDHQGQQPANHLPLLAGGAIFGSKRGKKPQPETYILVYVDRKAP